MVLYTDGITEATNPGGESFFARRLQHNIVQYAHLNAETIVSNLIADVDQFVQDKP